MGGRYRLGVREMTWFWWASSSPQGVPAERGPNPANPFYAHTRTHTKMCLATSTYIQYIQIHVCMYAVPARYYSRPPLSAGKSHRGFKQKVLDLLKGHSGFCWWEVKCLYVQYEQGVYVCVFIQASQL